MTDVHIEDRELPGDKGQLCDRCNVQFKYQYLYDDHFPCPASLPLDPTTAAIAEQNAERDRLRAEVPRLERALVAAYTEVEVVKAEAARLKKLGDTMFVEGYDQAVHEIRNHFTRQKQPDVVAEIDKICRKEDA